MVSYPSGTINQTPGLLSNWCPQSRMLTVCYMPWLPWSLCSEPLPVLQQPAWGSHQKKLQWQYHLISWFRTMTKSRFPVNKLPVSGQGAIMLRWQSLEGWSQLEVPKCVFGLRLQHIQLTRDGASSALPMPLCPASFCLNIIFHLLLFLQYTEKPYRKRSERELWNRPRGLWL